MREAFERSIALDPLHVPALIGLTRCYLYTPAIAGGSATKAEEFARRAQKLDPVNGASGWGRPSSARGDGAMRRRCTGRAWRLRTSMAGCTGTLATRWRKPDKRTPLAQRSRKR